MHPNGFSAHHLGALMKTDSAHHMHKVSALAIANSVPDDALEFGMKTANDKACSCFLFFKPFHSWASKEFS
jgi:hypothetical protein